MVERLKLAGRADFLLTFLPVIIVQTILYIYIYIYIHTYTHTGISTQAYKHTRMSKEEVGEKREKNTEKGNA